MTETDRVGSRAVDDGEPLFNPFEPGYPENPYPQYARLREFAPVHPTGLGQYVVTQYDDVLRLLRDNSLSVEDRHAAPTPLDALRAEVLGDSPDTVDTRRLSMLDRDPPDHTRLRRLVSRVFTPRRISALEPRIQQLVDAMLDRMADDGGGDLIDALAFPLPFEVISEMLGLPDTDRDQIRTWSGLLVRNLEPVNDPDMLVRMADAGSKLVALVHELIAWKRDHPDDLLLSRLIEAEDDGDMLTDDELVSQVLLLFVAGHETTVNLIGNAALALLRHPEQARRWIDEPELADNAIEEFLRYDAPVQMTRRITLEDTEVRGVVIPAGTFVLAGLASANRDTAKFGPDAATLDLTRADARDHVAFGGGAHYCLGAALARLEAKVALQSLLERFPSFESAGDPVYNGRINLRGLDELPVRLSPRTAP